MSDLDLEALGREAREQVRPGEPPLDRITAVRRRPRPVLVAVAAAAAVALVAGVTLALPRGQDQQPGPVPSRPAMKPPPGDRWVGAGDLVLAVPSSWSGSQYGCESDPRPSVVYDVDYWRGCQDTSTGRTRRPSALWVVGRDARPFVSEERRRARIPVPGLAVRTSRPWRLGGDAGTYWYRSLVDPSSGTVFVAQARDRSEVVRIIASARRTPPGVSVPADVAGSDVSDALAALDGYDVTVRRVAGFYRKDSVVGSEPAFGSPLRPGGRVTLTVSSGLGDEPVMTDAFLGRHEIVVEPLGTITDQERRQIADSRARVEHQMSKAQIWDHQLVLRRITAKLPSRNGVPLFRHRLAWLWLTPEFLTRSLGGPCCHHRSPPSYTARAIDVYDALTGDFVWGSSF